MEEILESIWKVEEQGDSTIEKISQHCPIASITDELSVLEKKGLITREASRIYLSATGRKEAEGVVRRHRLAETLFAAILNLDAKKREEIACEVEHTLLPEVEEAICTLLGHPAFCPDGKPIMPGPCCNSKRTMTSTIVVNLTALAPGESGRITYITPKFHERLHRLTSFGLIPGTVITLHRKSPIYCLRFEGTEIAIDKDVAEDIFVSRIK
ncbi:MAG: FeoA domain-containing protein [Deltaproteobacteria bacterium]|nr:FeoA domain-containing protein [Deltaproteobacteria bacterium]